MEDSRRNNIGLWQDRNDFMICPDFLRVRIDGTGFRSARILTWQHVMHDWSIFVLYTYMQPSPKLLQNEWCSLEGSEWTT